MTMMESPSRPILLAANSFQLAAKLRRNRRSRIRHKGSLISKCSSVETAVAVIERVPSLVADPRIEIHIEDVGNQMTDESQDTDESEHAHRYRYVFEAHRVKE